MGSALTDANMSVTAVIVQALTARRKPTAFAFLATDAARFDEVRSGVAAPMKVSDRYGQFCKHMLGFKEKKLIGMLLWMGSP
jgi:hypothetical protein